MHRGAVQVVIQRLELVEPRDLPVEDRGRLYRHRTFYTVDEYLKWAREHPELDAGK